MPLDSRKCHAPHAAAAWNARMAAGIGAMQGDRPERLEAAITAWMEDGQTALGRPVSWGRVVRHAAQALDPGATGPVAERIRRMATFAAGLGHQAPRVHLTYNDRLRAAAGGALPECHTELEANAVARARVTDYRSDPADAYHEAVLAWLHDRGYQTEARKLVAAKAVLRLESSIVAREHPGRAA